MKTRLIKRTALKDYTKSTGKGFLKMAYTYKRIRFYFCGIAFVILMNIVSIILPSDIYYINAVFFIRTLLLLVCMYQLRSCNKRLRFLFGTTVAYDLLVWGQIFTGLWELLYPATILEIFNLYLLYFGLSELAKQNKMVGLARSFKRMFFFVALIFPIAVITLLFLLAYSNPQIFMVGVAHVIEKPSVIILLLYAFLPYELYLVRKLYKGIQAREEGQKKARKRKR